jgi:hypothetical protein
MDAQGPARRALTALGVAIVAWAAAAAGPAQRPADPPAPFEWSAERRLSWADYVGRPDLASDFSAMTGYRVTFEERCIDDAFTFRVVSLFLPDRSWVKPEVLTNRAQGRRMLAHEQTHFDLSEVQARALRRELQALAAPCSLPAAGREAIVRRHLQVDAETQARYDRDTFYGANERQQVRWDADVARALK